MNTVIKIFVKLFTSKHFVHHLCEMQKHFFMGNMLIYFSIFLKKENFQSRLGLEMGKAIKSAFLMADQIKI